MFSSAERRVKATVMDAVVAGRVSQLVRMFEEQASVPRTEIPSTRERHGVAFSPDLSEKNIPR